MDQVTHPGRYSICNRERAPMRRGRYGSKFVRALCGGARRNINCGSPHGRPERGHGGGPVLLGPGQQNRAGIVWHLAGDLAARTQGDRLMMGLKPCPPPEFESECRELAQSTVE